MRHRVLREIPKVIYSTYHHIDKIPSFVAQNREFFAPDYKYKVLDDKDGAEFITKYFQPEVLAAYHGLRGAHRADLLRYCLLFIFGGVYMDIKTELLMPLTEVLVPFPGRRNNLIYVVDASGFKARTIYNGVIAAPPQQDIFLKLIKYIVQTPLWLPRIHYSMYIRHMYTVIRADIGCTPRAGYNHGRENDFYCLTEEVSTNPANCPDGLDRYGFCSYIVDSSQGAKDNKRIKTRYSSYPWR